MTTSGVQGGKKPSSQRRLAMQVGRGLAGVATKGRRLLGRMATTRLPAVLPGAGGASQSAERSRPQLTALVASISPGAEAARPTGDIYEPSTSISLYMREVGKVPLLSPEEEVELARRVRAGDAEAREQMILANLRLVVKIAREYEGLGLPLLDLINEGNLGLIKAVERFDPSKGAKLSTYSSWWIKQAVRRALANQGKTIRLPVHVVDKICHMKRTATQLEEVLGREPSDEELAQQLGTTAARVGRWRRAALRPASLEAPLGDDDSSRLGDVVMDERAENPYDELEEKTSIEKLREVMSELTPREAMILRFRFGLDGDGEQTLEEIGEKFGVTRERIRQLQNGALEKLRRLIEAPGALPNSMAVAA